MSGKGRICKHNPKEVVDHRRRKGCTKTCDFGLPRRWESISPVRYLKHVGGKVAAVVVRITSGAAPPNTPPKERAKPSIVPVDCQRAEAIHDCIDFINSSSSLARSNLVAR